MLPLIFYEGIVEPPSESLALRAVCLSFETDFVLEVSENEYKDIYFHWLKTIHLDDFINDIVTRQEKVYGLRLGNVNKNPCLKIDRVSWDNVGKVISIIT